MLEILDKRNLVYRWDTKRQLITGVVTCAAWDNISFTYGVVYRFPSGESVLHYSQASVLHRLWNGKGVLG